MTGHTKRFCKKKFMDSNEIEQARAHEVFLSHAPIKCQAGRTLDHILKYYT